MIKKRQESWNDKWGKMREKGRMVFALTKAFYISAIITIIALGFVYFTDYQLKISKGEFAAVLFVVLFLYKTVKNYFIDWPRNEKRYTQNKK